jgi:hypothetical protein
MLRLLSVNCKPELISNGQIGCFRNNNPTCPKSDCQNEFGVDCFKQLRN